MADKQFNQIISSGQALFSAPNKEDILRSENFKNQTQLFLHQWENKVKNIEIENRNEFEVEVEDRLDENNSNKSKTLELYIKFCKKERMVNL